MKVLFLFITMVLGVSVLNAQKKIDSVTAYDLLKLLPNKIKGVDVKLERDKVKNSKGFIGVTAHRDYGSGDKMITIELINESPSLIPVNNFLAEAKITDDNQYLITAIEGFNSYIQTIFREDGKKAYEILIPLTATLLTIKSFGFTRAELIEIANSIKVDKIAKKLEKL